MMEFNPYQASVHFLILVVSFGHGIGSTTETVIIKACSFEGHTRCWPYHPYLATAGGYCVTACSFNCVQLFATP